MAHTGERCAVGNRATQDRGGDPGRRLLEPGEGSEWAYFGQVPAAFSGAPIAFISAGLLSLAFMGFAGLTSG